LDENGNFIQVSNLETTKFQVTVMLYISIFIIDLIEISEVINLQTMIYLVAKGFDVKKKTARGYMGNGIIALSKITGLPRALFPIEPEGKSFIK
jgi:hypothetical protein